MSSREKGYSKIDISQPKINRNSQKNLSCAAISGNTDHSHIYRLDTSPIMVANEWENKCHCAKIYGLPFCLKARKWFEDAKKYKNNNNFDLSTMESRYLVR